MPMTGNFSLSKDISLYFHVPFCTRKCDYCHFYVIPENENDKERLMQGFRLEWLNKLPLLLDKEIVTIYFGGGTPALLGAERIATILAWIKETHTIASNVEITLEANPENSHFSLLREYANAGINRISIGVQTLEEPLLKRLGRTHSAEKAIEAIHSAKDAGIDNISIDLMYDLPHQSLSQWEGTLNKVETLPITHLSLYNLTIEPHTVFFKQREALQKVIPDEETSLRMYEMAVDRLSSFGLMQYEISAFAKEGFHSQHNKGYWLARPFFGYGPSAFSDWEGRRFRNIGNLSRYLKALQTNDSPVDFEEKLTPNARRRELFTIAIRLLEGVDVSLFEKQHGKLDEETRLTIQKLIQQGFLQTYHDTIALTKRGVLFYDTVASELV